MPNDVIVITTATIGVVFKGMQDTKCCIFILKLTHSTGRLAKNIESQFCDRGGGGEGWGKGRWIYNSMPRDHCLCYRTASLMMVNDGPPDGDNSPPHIHDIHDVAYGGDITPCNKSDKPLGEIYGHSWRIVYILTFPL